MTTAVTGKDIEIHYADEWAALYLKGELVTVGVSYNAEERAFQLLDVTTVHDDAFMRGQNQRDGVARTLAEVTEYRTAREQRAAEAARLREEAAALLSQAKALESPNA